MDLQTLQIATKRLFKLVRIFFRYLNHLLAKSNLIHYFNIHAYQIMSCPKSFIYLRAVIITKTFLIHYIYFMPIKFMAVKIMFFTAINTLLHARCYGYRYTCACTSIKGFNEPLKLTGIEFSF